jgi:hypothetical protein
LVVAGAGLGVGFGVGFGATGRGDGDATARRAVAVGRGVVAAALDGTAVGAARPALSARSVDVWSAV